VMFILFATQEKDGLFPKEPFYYHLKNLKQHFSKNSFFS